ncbi:MAG TPA: Gmad2 immunoglobulin-like domain-containing protein, partial [Spirillospora sp.]|nr:Gmad2 immunoglobulin-like domain-containing protein [Spirillospora sp.]
MRSIRSWITLAVLILLSVSIGAAGAQVGAAVSITSPAPGAVLPNMNAISVTGTGTALFENSLVVQALDTTGSILAQQPVTTDAPEVGGTGNWQTTLAVNVAPGTPGIIRAFATSPNDGSIVAEATINVTYGSAPLPSVITISTPTNGTILPNVGSFVVAGSATNVFEGTVVVQARDAANNVLSQIAVIADGAALGGTGNWQGNLSVNVAAGTHGNIRAFAESPMDGHVVAEAVVNVVYGAIPV